MPRLPKALRPGLMLALAGATLACEDSTIPIEADATIIRVIDNAFISNHVQVFPDQQVVWNFAGANLHNVTFDTPGIEPSPTMNTGQAIRRFETFTSGDVITYYCTVHGREVMSGIIAIR